jgi:hypothetical protein
MHWYNNLDHLMHSAMQAIENIQFHRLDKDYVWSVNTEQDPLESHAADLASDADPLEVDLQSAEVAL